MAPFSFLATFLSTTPKNATMKFLKKLGFFLLSLICLILIVSIFVPKEYQITRSIEIQADRDIAFEYLRYLKSQDEFGPWQKMDPHMKKSLTGEDGEPGAIATWKSTNEDVGSGEQEIISLTPGKRIDFELRFKEPFEVSSKAYFLTEPVHDNRVKVTWGFEGRSPWPWNFFLLFMDMDKELGGDLEKGLKNLKTILESSEADSY